MLVRHFLKVTPEFNLLNRPNFGDPNTNMAQSKLQKTVAAAALTGLMAGAAAYVVGCTHHEKDNGTGTQVSNTAASGRPRPMRWWPSSTG